MSIVFSSWTNHAPAAVITYNFDVNGSSQVPSNFGVVTATTYDWDDTANGGFWSNNSTSNAGNIATNGWVQGNFPKFQPSGTPTYTVTVSNNEQITGLFASTAQVLTINALGSGSLEAINIDPSMAPSVNPDGFLGTGSTSDVTINAPIKGAGQVNPSNGGNLRLNGTNTYTGGTKLSSTAALIHFGNDSAFGTGDMSIAVAGLVPLLASGGTTRTIANNFVNTINNGGVNFASDANTPVISTGTWTLGANNLVLKNNGVSTSPLTIAKAISGTGTAGVTVSGANGGSTIFGATNSYLGPTTVGVAGSTSITLKLGVAGSIASSSSVILAGGTLNPGGFNQAMNATTLGVTVASTIDFGAGASEVDFADSSALAWAGATLNLLNWDSAVDKLRFGTSTSGLTAAQLAKIEFNGSGLGTAQLDANGYVSVPEPSTIVLLLLSSLVAGVRGRRAA